MAPCRTCGCPPHPGQLCHAQRGNLECKCSTYVPQPACAKFTTEHPTHAHDLGLVLCVNCKLPYKEHK